MFRKLFYAALLLLIGCSGSPQLIEREIKVPYEIAVHDTIFLQDTVINQDTVWSGEVVDSLNNVIGWLKVYYKKKIAELKISKKDTVAIIDTVFIPQNQNIVPAVVSALTWWEQINTLWRYWCDHFSVNCIKNKTRQSMNKYS